MNRNTSCTISYYVKCVFSICAGLMAVLYPATAMETTEGSPAVMSGTSNDRAINPDITNIKNYHDEAFLYIQQALSCDEHGQGEQSIVLYQKGLKCILHALVIPTEGPGKDGEQWTKARVYKDKMDKTRVRVQARIADLLTDITSTCPMTDPLFSHESSHPSTAPDLESKSYEPVIVANDRATNLSLTPEEMSNAVEIFSIPDGVQIYFISSDGVVSAPSYPSSLGIYRMHNDPLYQQESSSMQTPPAFLSVGNWTYPLIPGLSPTLHINSGTYIFPEVNAPQEGNSMTYRVIILMWLGDNNK